MIVTGTYAEPSTEPYDDDETLGPCGCTDYHMSDCPTKTGGSSREDFDFDDWYERGM